MSARVSLDENNVNTTSRTPQKIQSVQNSGRIYNVVKQTQQEKNNTEKSVRNYVKCSVELEQKKTHLSDINTKIESINKEQDELVKKAVRSILPKMFGTTEEVLKKVLTESEIQTIRCDLKNKCLIIDEIGMQCIIKFLEICKGCKGVNFSCCKEEIHGNSIVNFFRSISKTQVSQVVFSKPLSDEEKKAATQATTELEKMGRTLKVMFKS